MTRKIGVREARQKFSTVLDWVEAGDEVVLLRRGAEVGVIAKGRPVDDGSWLDELAAMRERIRYRGRPLSEEVMAARREARY